MNTEQFIETMPLSSGCSVIKFDDCGLIAINKKAGRATHPNDNSSRNAKPPMLRARYNLRDEYYSWEDENGEKRRLYLINRLDSPTSGIVLASDNPEVAELAKLAFKEKKVQKTYMAICIGRVFCTDKWMDTIISRNNSGHVRSFSSKDGNLAITHCKFIREDL
jgi:23S rRNA pseudouridine955/2504/2580 synthase